MKGGIWSWSGTSGPSTRCPGGGQFRGGHLVLLHRQERNLRTQSEAPSTPLWIRHCSGLIQPDSIACCTFQSYFCPHPHLIQMAYNGSNVRVSTNPPVSKEIWLRKHLVKILLLVLLVVVFIAFVVVLVLYVKEKNADDDSDSMDRPSGGTGEITCFPMCGLRKVVDQLVVYIHSVSCPGLYSYVPACDLVYSDR